MIASFLSLLLPVATVYLILSGTSFSYAPKAVRVGVSVGLGWGVVSLLFFLWALIAGPRHEGLMAIELAILVVVVAMRLSGDSVKTFYHQKENQATAKNPISSHQIILALFMIIVSVSVVEFFWRSFNAPHGTWDAYAMWNLKARFLSRGGALWDNVFLLNFSHPDYPLAIPALIGSRWAQFTFNETPLVPIMVAFGYTFGTVAILYGALSRTNGQFIAAIACITLLGSVRFFTHGLDQYADVPLGFYYLGFLALFAFGEMEEKTKDRLLYIYLAGAFLGLSVWTKNEGMLFFVAAIVGLALFSRRALLPVLVGAAPGVIVTMIFKYSYPISNDLISSNRSADIFSMMIDLDRYKVVLSVVIKSIITFGSMEIGGIPISLAIVVICVIAIIGVQRDSEVVTIGKTIFLTLLVTLTGYIAVYIVTPHDVKWHMSTSLHRLLVQLWPSFLFAIFLLSASEKGKKIQRVES